VHTVSQCPNLRHFAEPLGGAVGLLEAVSFKEATESVCRGRTADAMRVVSSRLRGLCNAKTAGGKGCADTWNRQKIGVGRTQRTCGSVIIEQRT